MAGEPPPRAIVEGIYALYTAKGCPGMPGDEATLGHFLTPDLARAWAENGRKSDTSGDLDDFVDFDPFMEGQDCKVTVVRVSGGAPTGERASVKARFRNFGEATTIAYDLVLTPSGWRVSDLHLPNGGSLRALLKMK